MSRGRIAGLLFVATLAILLLASRSQGNVRDEGYYFDAAELYYGWYGELGDNLVAGRPQRSFSRAAIDRWFSYNHEHPALMKTLSGLSWRLLHKCTCPQQAGRHPLTYRVRHRTLGLLSEEAALRLPTQVAVAAMVALVFLFGAGAWGPSAGLLAAGLTLASPRLFFDAQLATFDAPIAALWLATVYAYWRATSDRRWGIITGVIFGFALATKHNAFFIPFVLLVHWLWSVRKTLWARRIPPFPFVFVWMALVGPLVYLVCWPWLWHHTLARFSEYVMFHMHHVYYNMEYFGVNYNKPPSPLSYPYVMTLLTLPVITLALAGVGAVGLLTAHAKARGADGDVGLLIGLNAVFPLAILTVTGAPIFGATKHWHAAIPFLALLGGYAFFALTRALALPRWATAALGLLLCFPAAAETYRAHPYGLSHYNLLAGGPPGGADLGMNRQFWGYATDGLLPWINQHAKERAPIYWHDTNQAQLNMDVRENRLRPDLLNTGLEEPGVRASDIALVIHEKHFNKYEYWIWDAYGTTRPAVVLDDEGVPLVTLYERRHQP